MESSTVPNPTSTIVSDLIDHGLVDLYIFLSKRPINQ